MCVLACMHRQRKRTASMVWAVPKLDMGRLSRASNYSKSCDGLRKAIATGKPVTSMCNTFKLVIVTIS